MEVDLVDECACGGGGGEGGGGEEGGEEGGGEGGERERGKEGERERGREGEGGREGEKEWCVDINGRGLYGYLWLSVFPLHTYFTRTDLAISDSNKDTRVSVYTLVFKRST